MTKEDRALVSFNNYVKLGYLNGLKVERNRVPRRQVY